MIEICVTERIEAAAAAVWGLVGGFNEVRRWVPSVEHSTKVGDGVGCERTLLISGGARIVERLDAYDVGGRSYTYGYVAGPVPVSSYETTLTVLADGDDACTVSWSSRIEPEGLPAEEVARLYSELYRAGMSNIKRIMAKTFRRADHTQAMAMRSEPGPGGSPPPAQR